MMTSRKMKTGLVIALTLCFYGLVVNAGESAGQNCLWRISSGGNAVYLLGSVHLLKSNNYPLDDAIEKAFEDSRTLVLEVDIKSMADPKAQQMMLSKGLLAPGDSLEKQLNEETYEQAKTKTEELGLDIAAFKQLKPWFFAMTIALTKLQALGFNARHGIDMYFFSKASRAGKQVLGLETFEQQLEMFDTLSSIDPDELVLQTIKELDIMEKEMDKIIRAWSTGDLQTLEAVMLKSFNEHPAVYETLITERNKKWLAHIESLLTQKDNHMIVVGAAHLAGRDGLVELLTNKGYSVEQW